MQFQLGGEALGQRGIPFPNGTTRKTVGTAPEGRSEGTLATQCPRCPVCPGSKNLVLPNILQGASLSLTPTSVLCFLRMWPGSVGKNDGDEGGSMGRGEEGKEGQSEARS